MNTTDLVMPTFYNMQLKINFFHLIEKKLTSRCMELSKLQTAIPLQILVLENSFWSHLKDNFWYGLKFTKSATYVPFPMERHLFYLL